MSFTSVECWQPCNSVCIEVHVEIKLSIKFPIFSRQIRQLRSSTNIPIVDLLLSCTLVTLLHELLLMNWCSAWSSRNCRWHSASSEMDCERGRTEASKPGGESSSSSSRRCLRRWLLGAVVLTAANDPSDAAMLLFRRWSEDWSSWWVSATSQKYNR